jgi:hypothetical protein
MLFRRIRISSLLLALSLIARAQHQELNEQPAIWQKKLTEDSNAVVKSFGDLFRKGTISGHFRSFGMTTINDGDLKDYQSWAVGGGIKLQTAPLHGFQAGISGFFIYNLAGTDLSIPDPITQQANRYEIALYDVEDPTNRSDLDRLEELYLRYQYKRSSITLGKQLLNTPFINLQDGRMRPTEVEGIWTEWRAKKHWQAKAGFLYGVSPRGTVRWYSVKNSIGIYSMGITEHGQRSDYAGNLQTKGILLHSIQYEKDNFKIQWWNQHTENIFNSSLVQIDYEKKSITSTWFTGVQWIRQDAIGNGDQPDPVKQYAPNDWSSAVYGLRVGWKNKRWETSLNYTRITKEGRYLMPREWGRDPFFTFMPRERNEGLGDVHAFVGKLQYLHPKRPIQASVAVGQYQLPDVLNSRLNKYGMPSYRQLNIDLRYRFEKFWKGLDMQVLYVYKQLTGDTHDSLRYVINKVNMNQWNWVLNFQF